MEIDLIFAIVLQNVITSHHSSHIFSRVDSKGQPSLLIIFSIDIQPYTFMASP